MPDARKIDLTTFSVMDLLNLPEQAIEELMKRKIVRTRNKPLGDYAEWLVAKVMGLTLADNSEKGYDARKGDIRYQIKSRHTTNSVQLSPFHRLEERSFDYLIGVIFKSDFSIDYAAKMPWQVVNDKAGKVNAKGQRILHLKRNILEVEEVEDITEILLVGQKAVD